MFCDDAIAFQTASVCIPPCYVKRAYNYVSGKMTICTVIGFPLGNQTTETKVFEAQNAIENGAEEIDMVINIGALKAGDTEYVLHEIRQLKAAVGRLILKVIIETCLLTEAEKITMCKIVTQAGLAQAASLKWPRRKGTERLRKPTGPIRITCRACSIINIKNHKLEYHTL